MPLKRVACQIMFTAEENKTANPAMLQGGGGE